MNILSNLKQYHFHIFSLTLIVVMGIIVMAPVNRYALCCDDITVLQNVISKSVSWRPVKEHLLNAYAASYIYMFTIAKVFGLKAANFFIIGTVLHILAAVTAYSVVYAISKKNTIALFVGLLTMIGFGGIEASDGAVNVNVYAAIIFLGISVLGIYYHFHKDNKSSISWNLLIGYAALFIAFCISPIRMHGSVIIYCTVETVAYFYKKSTIKQAISRTVCVLIIAITILKILGVFGGSGAYTSNKTTSQLQGMATIFISKYSLYPFSTIANLLLPHDYTEQLLQLNALAKKLNTNLIIPFLLVIIVNAINIIFYKFTYKNKKIAIYLFISSIFITMVYWFTIPRQIPHPVIAIPIGIIYFYFFLNCAIWEIQKKQFKYGFIILGSLVWIFSFSIISHLYFPTEIFAPSVRYLTIATVGAYVLVGILVFEFLPKIFDLINIKNKIVILVLSVLLAIGYIRFNILQVNNRFYTYLPYRDDAIVMKIFNTMNQEIRPHYKEGVKVIYISVKDLSLFYYAVKYGGYERFSLYNKDYSYEHMPYFVTDKNDLEKIIANDQLTLGKYGIPGSITVNQIYAYTLSNKGATSQTDLVREELRKQK